ncbi:hypothetical protein [Synechococcus sp. RC10B2]|uniref:hypothetical protein n=1 Tax=Synechococcus sp. RC10B2 TaxID=2964530 RepID=UPI0039C6BB82
MAMRWIQWFLIGVVSASMLSAWADGRGYEPRTVPVNAGVVMFSASDNLVRDVYTFYAMDRRTDLKPLGLSFRNPFAQAGTTRNQAAYWLVDVSRLNDNQLARYRILLISRTSWAGMDAEIREKLRRFVDGGGTLWVDMPQQGASGTLFFPEVAPVANTAAINIVNLNHPLLRGYYTLTPAEMASMGLRGRGFGGGALNISANRPVLQIVTAVNANTPVIAAATYGSGRIIVSAAGIAAAINAPLVSTRPGREGQAFELGMDSVPDLELKFAYNLVRWAGAGSSDAFNARRANAVADQYGAPLGMRWRDSNTQYSLQNGAPVVYGGLVFVVSGNRLICYDAVPSRDLDGDGRADDGIPDYERGESFDMVWEVNLGGQSSPPVVVETPRGLQVVVLVGAQVRGYWALPRDSQGRIPTDPRSVWSIQLPPPAGTPPTTGDQQIPAPIVIDNTLLLVPAVLSLGAQTSAGFFAVSLTTDPPQIVTTVTSGGSQELWYQPRTGSAGNWLLPPVAGYVPNYGQGGGNDIVVYFGTRRDVGGTGTGEIQGIQAFWIGAKGEVLTPAIDSAGAYQRYLRSRITGRARYYVPTDGVRNPLHPRVFRIKINNTTGEIEEIVDITERCRFNQAEQGRITYDEDTTGYTFIADYYIDWAHAANFNIMFRTFASLPPRSDSPTVPPQELRGFTLAPNGVLYITTGTDGTDPNTASGSVIALQEQSPPTQQQTRGGSKVLWRWQSHGGYSQIVPGPERTNPVIVPPSTVYREPNEYFMRFVGQFLRFSHDFAPNANAEPQRQWMNFTFRGAPIYYDGAVYAFAEGQARVGPFGFPYTVIVALDAEPEQFVIDLGAPIAATGDIRISQRDYGRSGPNPITNIVSTLTYSPNSPNPDIKVDFTAGQIRITGFAQAESGGQIRLLENVLSLTQPVQISIGNTFNTLVDPDSIAGNWNNLRWYAVLLGQQLQANPVVVGDTMYLPCEITVPTDSGLQTFGGILGIATDPYRLQPDLAQRKDQAGTIPRVDPNNPLKYQSIIRWPFIDDLITDLENNPDPGAFLRELFRRFAVGFQLGTGLSPIAVGEGLLVISSGQGLHAYSRQSTIIADESRLLEVDTAGRVVWSTENTQLDFYTGSIVSSKARYPITPNARVYRYGENELLIVEPERNRVAIIDRAGAEIRTITQFIPDRVPLRDTNGNITQIVNLRNESVAPNSNYIAGAPTNLRNPTDVTVWTEFVLASRNPYTNPQPLEYWIHYTITDAGNARVVDIVDRYQADPQTYTVGAPVHHPDLGPMLGVLYWMTPSQRLERNYRYVSAQRFEYWDGSQTRIGFATLVQNTAASAFEATGMGDPLDPRTPEAGMITLQLIVNGRDQTIYIRRMTLPDRRDVPILAPVAIDTAKRSARGGDEAGLYLLVTTSTGVYELQVPLTGTVGDTLPVTWMLTNEAYTNAVRRRIGGNDLADDGNGNLLRPILFKPRQARYLPNGNVLIVNGYNGTTLVRSGNSVVEREFPGEVFELNANNYNPQDYPRSDDLGFSNASIVWSTLDRPELSGSSQLRKPSSADRGGF